MQDFEDLVIRLLLLVVVWVGRVVLISPHEKRFPAGQIVRLFNQLIATDRGFFLSLAARGLSFRC